MPNDEGMKINKKAVVAIFVAILLFGVGWFASKRPVEKKLMMGLIFQKAAFVYLEFRCDTLGYKLNTMSLDLCMQVIQDVKTESEAALAEMQQKQNGNVP